MASDPRFSEAFRRYHVPTVALAFSDDILAGSESLQRCSLRSGTIADTFFCHSGPRMIDTPSRVLGTPTSKETVRSTSA